MQKRVVLVGLVMMSSLLFGMATDHRVRNDAFYRQDELDELSAYLQAAEKKFGKDHSILIAKIQTYLRRQSQPLQKPAHRGLLVRRSTL